MCRSACLLNLDCTICPSSFRTPSRTRCWCSFDLLKHWKESAAYKNRIHFPHSFHRFSPTFKSLGRLSTGTYLLQRPRQESISLCGARGLRVIRSCLLVCCSHSRLLSSSNSASQLLSRLVTFASASYGLPPSMTKQSNFDDVPFSKPGRAARTLKGMKVATPSLIWITLSSTFGHGVCVLASD